jgi:predicted permease
MGLFAGQLKQVFRRLRKAPLFTGIAILTLGLGIGSNTAIFSVLDGVLLKALPYPHPEELIGMGLTAPAIHIKDMNLAPSTYLTFRDENRTFESFGVYTGDRVSVTGVAEPEQVHSLLVTNGVLVALGAQPILGRRFSANDDLPTSPETVMLCYGYWQKRFGGERSVVGRRLQIDGKAKEVIGVLPRDFRFLDMDVNLLQPIRIDRSKVLLGQFNYNGVARLKPGVTLAQATSDAKRMLPIANRSFPAPPGFSAKLFEEAHIAPVFRPFKQELTGDIGPTLWVLMGTIGIVLLIACANVANLLLVRVEGRHMELAIRSALGASAGRIAYELLFESLSVALLGGMAGLALAFGAVRLLVALAPVGIPRVTDIRIDGGVLLFALALSVLTGLLFGSVPVLKYAGQRLNASLREGGRSVSQSRERHRSRNVLVVVQVSLALVLLISSGLMIRTFRALNNVQPGFTDAESVQTFSLSIPEAQVAEADKVLRMETDIVERLQQVPGVTTVAMTTAVPMGGNSSTDLLYARDHTYAEGQIPPVRRFVFVSPGYQHALGNKLITGRDFGWDDLTGKRNVTMISESFAREYWGSAQAALHKEIREGSADPWREIVGVVGDVHADGVNQKAPDTAYFPIRMHEFWGNPEMIQRDVSFVIRSTRSGSESFLNDARRAIWSVNANLPLAEVRTLDQLYKRSMARTSFTLVLLMIAAAMALVLGGVGIYGVIAYSVAQRTREIGIRMALGASTGEVSGMFVREGILLTGIGALCGLVAAAGVMRLLETLLFGVKPVDVETYAGMLLLLLTIAALASYLPARRAAAIDPATALRLD